MHEILQVVVAELHVEVRHLLASQLVRHVDSGSEPKPLRRLEADLVIDRPPFLRR